MVIKVKLVGQGTDSDPHHVNLPDYNMIFVNYDEGTALVQVPDASHGLTEDDIGHEKAQKTSHGLYAEKLCDDCIDKVHAHYDKRYLERKGEFRIEGA